MQTSPEIARSSITFAVFPDSPNSAVEMQMEKNFNSLALHQQNEDGIKVLIFN